MGNSDLAVSTAKNSNVPKNESYIFTAKDKKETPRNSTGNPSIFLGSLQNNNAKKVVPPVGSKKGASGTFETESKLLERELTAQSRAFKSLGTGSSGSNRLMTGMRGVTEAEPLGAALKNTRGAAYMNDIGEGLKPAIGGAIAKRCWYPSLIYVLTSVYNKTVHDKDGNEDFSIIRGCKEFGFQLLASLCGPILLVNFGQNTIGKLLNKIGSCIGLINQGKNPLKAITMKNIATGTKNTAKEIGFGIFNAAKDLPKEIKQTCSLACKDIAHPVKTCKKAGHLFSNLYKSKSNFWVKCKNLFSKFKENKTGFFFGKNGILFGEKGLFGKNGILFGQKSSRVIGGLLGILLLYKAVDKVSAAIVNREEDE